VLGSVMHGSGADEMVAALARAGVDIRPEAMGVTWADAEAAMRTLGTFVREAGLWHSVADERGVARALTNLADLARQEGDLPRARGLYRDSLALRRSLRDMPGMATSMEKLAAALVADDPAAAARLLGAAEALRETIGAPLPPVDRPAHAAVVAAVQGTLAASVTSDAWAIGRSLPLDAAVAEALAMPDAPMSAPMLPSGSWSGAQPP